MLERRSNTRGRAANDVTLPDACHDKHNSLFWSKLSQVGLTKAVPTCLRCACPAPCLQWRLMIVAHDTDALHLFSASQGCSVERLPYKGYHAFTVTLPSSW